METTKDLDQPKVKGGEQKVLLDPTITAETDELDPKFDETHRGILENENKAKPLEE